MKFATVLSVFAVAGLDFVTAKSTRTGLDTAALLKRGVHLNWYPLSAYQDQQAKRLFWEDHCRQVLDKEGCGVGRIHKGELRLIRSGKRTSYLNVEGAPSEMMDFDKKFRIFSDGTSQDVTHRGWSRGEREAMRAAKRLEAMREAKNPKRKVHHPPPRSRKSRDRMRETQDQEAREDQEAEEQKAQDAQHGPHVSWDPIDAYRDQPQRRSYWERRCRKVLADKGCNTGTMHKGETKMIVNGKNTYYIRVEGNPATPGMERPKMRVFQDGSAEDDWTWRDRKLMRDAKRYRRVNMEPQGDHNQEGQGAVLSWNPVNAYENSQPQRRLGWERVCRAALERAGCGAGLIHQGDTKEIRNGQKTSYIKLAGASSPGMEYDKKFRVFQDGFFEDHTEHGWTPKDRKALWNAQQQRPPRPWTKRPRIEYSPVSSDDEHTQDEPMDSQVRDRYKRPRGRPRKGPSDSTQMDGAGAGTQAQGLDTGTEASTGIPARWGSRRPRKRLRNQERINTPAQEAGPSVDQEQRMSPVQSPTRSGSSGLCSWGELEHLFGWC